jgi:hypothetical protein
MLQVCCPDQVQATTASTFDDLVPHLAAWDRLAWEAPQALPTLSPAWIDAFLRHRLAEDERWLCIFAYLGDILIGVMPIIVAPHPIFGKKRPLLRTPHDSFATSSGDIALSPTHAKAALQALLSQLDHEVPGHLGVELRAVRQNSPIWAALQSIPRGYMFKTGLEASYSVIDVQGNFPDYLSKLGNLRRNLVRYRKRLSEKGSVSVELRKGDDVDEEFLAAFLKLEAAGWKGRNGTAILSDSNQTEFYSTLIRNLIKHGRCEWHILRVDSRVIAAGIGVQCRGALMLPKIAYDEEFSDCMPGNLLSEEVIKDAFERPDVTEINHMSNASWHNSWRMSQDRYTSVHLVRRDVSAWLLHWPVVAAYSAYQGYVRPRVPAALRDARRALLRWKERRLNSMNGKTSTAQLVQPQCSRHTPKNTLQN